MGSGKLLVGGTAAAATSPAGHCQAPGQAQDPNPDAPPRDGVAEPVPVPMGTHPPVVYLVSKSCCFPRICVITGQQERLSPVQGQLLGPGPHSCPWQ